MSTARKYAFNRVLMSPESRRKSYASINILWVQMRPDLRFESKNDVREERLAWIADFLGLKNLASTTKLTDGQIGFVLDEMRRMTGTKFAPKQSPENIAPSSGNVVNLKQFKQQHYASAEQKFTLRKIIAHLGWSENRAKDFLIKRKFGESIEKIAFKKANSLMIILLNIAADKELRAQGKTKISRKMTADYLPQLKGKLDIK